LKLMNDGAGTGGRSEAWRKYAVLVKAHAPKKLKKRPATPKSSPYSTPVLIITSPANQSLL
jgi:hypothetical protein